MITAHYYQVTKDINRVMKASGLQTYIIKYTY